MDNERYTGYARILESLSGESRLRSIPPQRDGLHLVDLCSNDYMGLARRQEKFERPSGSYTSSASRLLSFRQLSHSRLEERLASLYGRPALCFNSGYHANVGIVAALNIPDTLFVADKLVHASMIDGLMAGRCTFKRFPHNDIAALDAILARESGNHRQIVVMAESIYSMDGDKAPLAELVALREKYPDVLLYIDEAHAFGVRGRQGLGLCEETGVIDRVDIIVGTLGKAAASVGAFCIADRCMTDFLINTSRSFIFSTALPPAVMEWSLTMVDALTAMSEEREHLKRISRLFRTQLGLPDGDTPIVPLLTGSADKALTLSRRLADKGIMALPIRRPTVPPGGERIRFSLNASMSEDYTLTVAGIIKETIQK